jgi:hypothetical protein
MVTNYLEKTEDKTPIKQKDEDITSKIKDIDDSLAELETLFDKPKEDTIEETIDETVEKPIEEKEKSHFINLE